MNTIKRFLHFSLIYNLPFYCVNELGKTCVRHSWCLSSSTGDIRWEMLRSSRRHSTNTRIERIFIAICEQIKCIIQVNCETRILGAAIALKIRPMYSYLALVRVMIMKLWKWEMLRWSRIPSVLTFTQSSGFKWLLLPFRWWNESVWENLTEQWTVSQDLVFIFANLRTFGHAGHIESLKISSIRIQAWFVSKHRWRSAKCSGFFFLFEFCFLRCSYAEPSPMDATCKNARVTVSRVISTSFFLTCHPVFAVSARAPHLHKIRLKRWFSIKIHTKEQEINWTKSTVIILRLRFTVICLAKPEIFS